MKKIYYTLFSLILIVPTIVSAQVTRPTNSYGLAENINANSIVEDVIKFVTTFLASLAILMIVVSGIMYMVSGGDQQKAETAKNILTYSVIGLVIAILAYAIVIFIGTTFGANWS
jgi:hypothetical protein